MNFIPYTEIPLNLTTCSQGNHTGDPLVTTCDLMPRLAKAATLVIADTLNCSSSPPPHCNQIDCAVVSNNDSLIFKVIPCHDPPAFELINRDSRRNVRFNQTFASSVMSINASIGDTPVILNVTVVQHPERLTLGLGVRRWGGFVYFGTF